MKMQFAVQKDPYTAHSIWKVVATDQNDVSVVAGRWDTKRDATAHVKYLDSRWSDCVNDDWMIDTFVV
jgi:hypothetical protein